MGSVTTTVGSKKSTPPVPSLEKTRWAASSAPIARSGWKPEFPSQALMQTWSAPEPDVEAL